MNFPVILLILSLGECMQSSDDTHELSSGSDVLSDGAGSRQINFGWLSIYVHSTYWFLTRASVYDAPIWKSYFLWLLSIDIFQMFYNPMHCVLSPSD